MQRVQLSTGAFMPIFGLGTFKIRGYDTLYTVLDCALRCGYRSFDTAAVYRNEADIGKCLKTLLPKHQLKREDIFITSKLGPKDQGSGKARQAALKSLAALDTEYLDLYLIHWPGAAGLQPTDSRHPQLRRESWQDLEQLHKEGKLRAIGVSNYTLSHLEELLQHASIPPAVNQVEFHPHLVQRQLQEFCHKTGIHLQAYSSLGSGSTDNKLKTDPVVTKMANRLNRTVPQILLCWAIQQNIGVLPKSSNPDHVQENSDVFSFALSQEDMQELTALDRQEHYCWNPASVS